MALPELGRLSELPPVEKGLLEEIRRVAAAFKYPTYIVGGFVRDLFLEDSVPSDIDLTVCGNHKAFARAVARACGGEVALFSDYLTAVVKLADRRIDVGRARRESYPVPGENPMVGPGDLDDDLFRRDFSINAMAISLYPEWDVLIDPFLGLSDLKRGLIRVLRQMSFIEDPTRILRGVRFKTRFSFSFAPKTKECIEKAVSSGALLGIPKERLHKELILVVLEPDPPRVFLELAEIGILDVWLPEFTLTPGIERALHELPSALKLLYPERRSSTLPLYAAVLTTALDEQAARAGLVKMGMNEDEIARVMKLREVPGGSDIDPGTVPRDIVVLSYLFGDAEARRRLCDKLTKEPRGREL